LAFDPLDPGRKQRTRRISCGFLPIVENFSCNVVETQRRTLFMTESGFSAGLQSARPRFVSCGVCPRDFVVDGIRRGTKNGGTITGGIFVVSVVRFPTSPAVATDVSTRPSLHSSPLAAKMIVVQCFSKDCRCFALNCSHSWFEFFSYDSVFVLTGHGYRRPQLSPVRGCIVD